MLALPARYVFPRFWTKGVVHALPASFCARGEWRRAPAAHRRRASWEKRRGCPPLPDDPDVAAAAWSQRAIAKLCSASCSGVRKIINLFNRGGVAALRDKPHEGGRPRKTDDRYLALLKQAVQRDPREMGYVFGCWTLERLREHLARKTRVIISTGHLARLMAENKRPCRWRIVPLHTYVRALRAAFMRP